MIPLYLSGSSRDLDRVRKVAADLERTGRFLLTDRWWEGAEVWAGKDGLHSLLTAVSIAAAHERAMRDAAIFWLLWPRTPSFGAVYELGYVTAHRWHQGARRAATVIVTGPGASDTVYTAAADYRDQSDQFGFGEVLRLANTLTQGGY